MNQPWIYMCSHPDPLSRLPLHSIPLGLPSAPARTLVSCIQPGLAICFTRDSILISMLFSQNIHPHLLPQSPKVCSVHLCLCFCLAYRVIITNFLNSIYIYIYVSILYWCLSFWLTSLCIMGSSFIHPIRTDSYVFFLMAE